MLREHTFNQLVLTYGAILDLFRVHQQTKNGDSSRKHQTKKQAFGEIKNVIHNQNVVTPLKPDQKQNKNTSSKFISPASIKIKQQSKSAYKSSSSLKTKKAKPPYNYDYEDSYLLDNFDFRGKCCLKQNKSDQEIWSEMNLYSDSLLDSIFNANELEQTEDDFCFDTFKEENEDLNFYDAVKDESNFIFWPDKKELQEENDIHLIFEKPSVLDFNC